MGRIARGDQINWNQVSYFCEIAATGSLKDAAEKLQVSPSTLSEHLANLESDLGLKLFQRQHRRLALTSDGARLYQCGRQMFEMGKRFVDILSPTPLGCYPISVGIVPGSSYGFAYSIVKNYIEQHREGTVNVLRYQHDALEIDLLEGKLDFGFTDRRSERRDIAQSVVIDSDLRFFVSSDTPRRDLANHLRELPLVLCRSERRVPSAVEQVLDALGIVPKSLVVSEYPSLVERLCRDGNGVAVLGKLHFAKDPGVRAVALPDEFPKLAERLYATWAVEAGNSAAVHRLKAFLK